MSSRLIDLVQRFAGRKVALIGDFMVDRYVYGNAERLSPEAPVPVLRFDHEDCRLGGAGHVAADLAALGCHVKVVGVVGDDEAGVQLRKMLDDLKVDHSGIVIAKGRCTTSKTRLVGLANQRSPQQMIRLDYEVSTPVTTDLAGQLIQAAARAIADAEVVLLEDYNKGVLTPAITQGIVQAARSRGKQVIVDPPKITDYTRYIGATALKLNRSEAEVATGQPARTPEQYARAGKKLMDSLGLEAIVITLDKDGAYVATRDGKTERRLTTRSRQVADVTGAGDMVLAALGAARAAGAEWTDAVAVANVAGGLEVERFGAIPVRPEEIVLELLSDAHDHLGKERTLDALLKELVSHRAAGRKIVFTNGCFDLIHLGHVKYFQFARAQGDLLVVGVNTDASIQRLKGPKRPVVNEQDRVGVLEELESIDYLVRFDSDTPIDLIKAIKPDVLVKGADYRKDQVVGWDIVEKDGGRVALAPLIDGRSTSNVIRAILDAYGDGSKKA
ncbi:MAG: D-glycero-beta-D-manno-heptose 1-phosphate adenylyltransferase [Tepidisphaeraceae bacterium]